MALDRDAPLTGISLRKRALFWVLQSVLMLVVGMAACEVLVRFIDHEDDYLTAEEFRVTLKDVLSHSWTEPGLEFDWIGQVGKRREFRVHVKNNSFGFHDAEHTIAKPPGMRRVLLVGDSFVEAFQVPVEQAIAPRLQARLTGAGERVEVIGLGESGFGMIEYRRLIEKWEPTLSADVVVICFYPGNDIRNASPSYTQVLNAQSGGPMAAYWARPERAALPGLFVPWSRLNLFVARFIETRHRRRRIAEWDQPFKIPADLYVYDTSPPPFVEEGLKQTFGDLTAIHHFLEGHGVKLIVASLTDELRMVDNYSESRARLVAEYTAAASVRWDFERPETRMAEFLSAQRIPFVNLQARFHERYVRERREYHFRSDGHWNATGHEWAAAALVDPIRRELASRPN